MKTSRRPPTRTPAGSVLITTLLLALLLGTVLASYLLMVRAENVSVARSQAWHSALTLAEAGVEEALAQLNPGALTTNVLPGNGWVLDDGLYRPNPPERELLGGRYAVGYTPDSPPTIYSTGYVAMPVLGDTIARVIRIQTTNASLYQAPLTAAKMTKSNYRRFEMNSYDSTVPNSSSLTNTGAAAAADELPDILPPFATARPFPAKSGGKYTLSGDYLVQGNLVLASNEKIFVAANYAARLYVQGNVTMNASAEVEIAPGGMLQMFVGGNNATLGSIDNQGKPKDFQYFGLPGNTNISLVGKTNQFVGVLYAPNANLTTISTSIYYDFFGALTVDTFTLRRNFRLHFDEDLLDHGPRRGFVATSWRELPL